MTAIHVAEMRVQDVVDVLSSVQSLAFLDKSVFESIGEQLQIIHRKRYKQQIDPDGNAWTPLNEKYLAKKKEQGAYKDILQYTGKMLDTLTHQATDYGVKFGSNAIQAASQHYGRDDIPSRKFVGINNDDRAIIAEEIKDAYESWLSKNS
jgi:phage virion morphogenesis protein